MGGGGAIGLDYGASLALGAAMGADMELLADILPAAEAAILGHCNSSDDDPEDDIDWKTDGS